MPQTRSARRKPASAALALLLLSLVLVACGGSSSSSSTTIAAAAKVTVPNLGQVSARFATLRACLTKNGIPLPKPVPGQPRALGGALGFGSQVPKGVSRAQYEAALRKCGLYRAGNATGSHRLASPTYRKALTAFATCMRAHGQNVPPPNTSGTGPIFNTSGLNPKSAQFKAATVACAGNLRSAFGAPIGE